jgi:HAD superfamily hydrolase (TIGR01549 family)
MPAVNLLVATTLLDAIGRGWSILRSMCIEVVFFDVGETLVNETRLWEGWAAYLGVSAQEFRKVLYETIERGEDHHRALEHFRPGLDLAAARRERTRSGSADVFAEHDLYADAKPCLSRLRSLGYRVGIAGNQPIEAEQALLRVGFETDLLASSTSWGIAKPSPVVFKKIIALAGVPASRIAYVGDRLDHDIIPARNAGMAAIFIERGPWGRAHAKRPEIAVASRVIASLDALPSALARL